MLLFTFAPIPLRAKTQKKRLKERESDTFALQDFTLWPPSLSICAAPLFAPSLLQNPKYAWFVSSHEKRTERMNGKGAVKSGAQVLSPWRLSSIPKSVDCRHWIRSILRSGAPAASSTLGLLFPFGQKKVELVPSFPPGRMNVRWLSLSSDCGRRCCRSSSVPI